MYNVDPDVVWTRNIGLHNYACDVLLFGYGEELFTCTHSVSCDAPMYMNLVTPINIAIAKYGVLLWVVVCTQVSVHGLKGFR